MSIVIFILIAAFLFTLTLEALKVSVWECTPEEFWHDVVDNLPGEVLPTPEEEASEANLRKLQKEAEAVNKAIEWREMMEEATQPPAPPAPTPMGVESISLGTSDGIFAIPGSC